MRGCCCAPLGGRPALPPAPLPAAAPYPVCTPPPLPAYAPAFICTWSKGITPGWNCPFCTSSCGREWKIRCLNSAEEGSFLRRESWRMAEVILPLFASSSAYCVSFMVKSGSSCAKPVTSCHIVMRSTRLCSARFCDRTLLFMLLQKEIVFPKFLLHTQHNTALRTSNFSCSKRSASFSVRKRHALSESAYVATKASVSLHWSRLDCCTTASSWFWTTFPMVERKGSFSFWIYSSRTLANSSGSG
mmetsp:Transcript_20628/g.52092  ORF Transcript_20628/g.52092 Transcript_20628/m.52092 type:complete len:245 (-) Transcript_20628:288-1022(-)